MKKTLFSILLITIVCAVTGCNKKKDLIDPTYGITPSMDSYQPMTAGSSWNYLVETSSSTDVITVKMTGKTMISNERTYHEATRISRSGAAQICYFHQTGDIYGYRGESVQSSGVLDLDHLDIGKPVNGTWELPINFTDQLNGINGKTKYKLLEKDITKVVGGKTFGNVMHTQIELQYDMGLGTGLQTYTTYDHYLAKGVGLIELDAFVSGTLMVKQTLTAYDIKIK